MKSVKIDLLFETSWEVCNKVGGIYTVLSTKAKTLQSIYKDKVIFIGPELWSAQNESPYFIESKTALKDWRKQALLPEGLKVRVGRWNIPGKPLVVLVDFKSMYAVKDSFYGEMWEKFHVDSLHAYGDYDEACAFSHAAGIVIRSLYDFYTPGSHDVVAHFDEWTTGMGLLYIKSHCPRIATVFTTHATSIGRSICGNGKPLYDYLAGYNGDQMAQELNMQSKHSLEKAAAHAADAFTTVSEVTSRECVQLIERKPDEITINGFELNFVPAKNRFNAARRKARKLLLDVASHVVGDRLDDDCFIIATSGRCEYRNKGIDLFLDVTDRLRKASLNRKTVAFVMVPAWMKEAREEVRSQIGADEIIKTENRCLTHTVNNPFEDPIACRMRQLGYEWNNTGRLSVIYVPCYLDGKDGIFNCSYYDLLIGMDATVFPSYYEPWGYTPLESVAFGVPTVTTSLSGFGQWVESSVGEGFDKSGVAVVNRTDSNYDQVADEITSALINLNRADETELAKYSAAAKATAEKAQWLHFIEFYLDAYRTALEKAHSRE
ncbi:MAG: glycogen/starch synthase [Muribaculaceae bacterium]|nr:glycogen/starch synthase [Muribaculaceae bacterium]